jgi:hypothetical protein
MVRGGRRCRFWARSGPAHGLGSVKGPSCQRATGPQTPVPASRLTQPRLPRAPLIAQQNVGNFISDRASSRVLAPPGGKTSISFCDDTAGAPLPARAPPARHTAPGPPSPRALYAAALPSPRPPPGVLSAGADALPDNNYTREVNQNVGNWLTERRTVRVAGGTPGGASQIVLG